MIAILRAGFRLLFFVCATSILILIFGFGYPFTLDSQGYAIRLRRLWLGIVPGAIGLSTSVVGQPVNQAALYIANHRSYLDPVLILRYVDVMPLSKSEVRKWPVIGLAAKLTGTLFVERGKGDSRAMAREAISDALKSGKSVLNFPEGTTGNTPELLPFQPGTFGIAAQLGVPIVPVAILYGQMQDAWVDNDTFLRHFFQTFGKPHVENTVIFCNPVTGNDPGALIRQTRLAIARHLGRQH